MATRVSSRRFVGRDAELGELRAALGEAAGGRPVLAFVAGESGVGKTRLVGELQRIAAEDGVRVLSGECVDLGEGELPFAPLVSALRPLARTGDPVLDTLPPAVREALGDVLPGLAGGGSLRRAPDDGAGARTQVFDALLELLDRLAADGGLLLCVEDLHWADRSTRAFLAYLAAALCTERVLVVATYRPDELHRRHPLRPLLAELERDARARRVALAPLTRAELAEQVAGILDGDAPGELVERLWARSQGNPLFAEELLAAGTDGRGAPPPTMREALLVRVERLDPRTQELLRLLSVARRPSHDVLAAASELSGAELRDALREAVASQIVVVDGDGRHAFRHALLQEVVADDLLPGERAQLHLALARALEPRMTGAHDAAAVAHHYTTAGDQPAALVAGARAAAAAEAVHAYGEAAALYERVLELWHRVADPERLVGHSHLALLRAAAVAHGTAHDPARAETLLRAAVEEVDASADPHLAAELLEHLARQQWTLGRVTDSRETRARALALLPEDEPSAERAASLASVAKELMLEGRYRQAVEAAQVAIDAARAAACVLPEIRALDALGISLAATGRPEEGFAALREAVARARAEDLPHTMIVSYVNLTDALMLAGHTDEARATADEGRRLAREIGVPSRWLDLAAAELAILAGDWSAADALLPEGGRRSMGTTFVNESLRRIDLALGRGEHAEARRRLDEVTPFTEGSREPQFIGPVAVQRAELERRSGDLDAARAAVDDGLDRIEFCSEDVVRIAMVSAAGVRVEADAALRARDLGDADGERLARRRTEDLLARLEAISGEEGGAAGPVEAAGLATARADAARVAGTQDPAAYEAAATAWDALGRPQWAADTRWRAAESSLALGDRAAAARSAAVAVDRARAIGATWLVSEIEGFAARARLKLEAVGAADDAGAGTGAGAGAAGADAAVRGADAAAEDPFGLTPREHQVLRLLADGRTNREIGRELFMAEKTASVHVSRILAKLDVRTRTEAAAVAHRLGLLA